jgi:hypothetical protein
MKRDSRGESRLAFFKPLFEERSFGIIKKPDSATPLAHDEI